MLKEKETERFHLIKEFKAKWKNSSGCELKQQTVI